jgi:hypothetical protein
LPIDTLVFFKSAHKTILKTTGTDNDLIRVCKGRGVLNKIEDTENRYKQIKIKTEKLTEIANFLLQKHSPVEIDIIKEYKLTETDLHLRVQCPSCDHILMDYQNGKWVCPTCSIDSKDAHMDAINAYFLLVKPSITNHECQTILDIPSPNISRKILISLHLPTTGHTKKRVYHQWEGNKSYCLIEEKLLRR